MSNKEIKPTQSNLEEDLNVLDDANEDLQEENKLNISKEEDVDDPELDKQFDEIMKGIKNPEKMLEDLEGMGDLMNTLFKDLKNQNGEELPKSFGDIINGENPQFDNFANLLLKEFLNKEVLYEPLKEARVEYQKFFKENNEKLDINDKERYNNQFKCLEELITEMEKQAEPNKDRLTELFEKMQSYGQPPPGVMDPVNNLPQEAMSNEEIEKLKEQFLNIGNPTEKNPFSNMGNSADKEQPDCNIF